MAATQREQSAQRAGTTAVEFAVVAPVILLLFFGAVEMCNLNFIKHTAANAAYEGARAAMLAGGTAEGGSQRAKQHLDRFGVGNGAEVTVTGTADRVTVTVRVPTHLNSYGLNRFSRDRPITRTCSLRRETRQAVP